MKVYLDGVCEEVFCCLGQGLFYDLAGGFFCCLK